MKPKILALLLALLSTPALAVDKTFRLFWDAPTDADSIKVVITKGVQPFDTATLPGTASEHQVVIPVNNGDQIKFTVQYFNVSGAGPTAISPITVVEGIVPPPGVPTGLGIQVLP